MTHLARTRRTTLARACLAAPILLVMACLGDEADTGEDLGVAEGAATAQLSVTLIDSGGFDYDWQVNDNNNSSGAWGAGDLAYVGYDLGSVKQVQEVWTYGDQAHGFHVQLFDASWSQTGWYDCWIDGGSIQWQGCDIPDTNARYVYVRYRTNTSGSWVQELDIHGDAAGSGSLPIPSGAFRGTYFSDKNLTTQVLQRQDAAVSFNWGTGSPASGIGSDNFSVRWEGDWSFATAGTYRFSTTSDDGSRVYVDGNLVVNHWSDHGATTLTGDVSLTAGTHRVKVEYYEAGGGASANVSWSLLSSPAGSGGVPNPPSGWVVDLNDNFDSLDWNKWKQWQNNVPLVHTVMYMNTQSNCVTQNGYLEMRATKRNDGSGTWDGCYLDQGTWWDSGAGKPAHPGYADYQVSFKANLPPGMGQGMYFLMWPVAESWGGTPWPPELDIVELPMNDGTDVMTTWHWDPDNKQASVWPQVDRTGGKQWVYTARRVGNTIRMWIGNPSTNQITEIPLPAQFSNNPDYKRMLVGMSNFIASTWAINGSPSAGWYGDANATGSTSWTAYIDYVKVWKPGPGMSGQ